MRRTLVAAAVVTVLVACSGGNLVRAPMEPVTKDTGTDGGRNDDPSGVWNGTATWSNGRRSDVTVDISAATGSLVARVSYTSSACTSEWRMYPSGSGAWAADEQSVQGSATCPRNGRASLSLAPTGDALDYEWRETVGALSIHGALKRTR